MPLHTKHLLNFCIVAIIYIFSTSCRKDQPDCDGNCFDITIAGKIYNKSTGSGLANESVKLQWRRDYVCWTCRTFKEINTSTDANGNFSFTQTIDSLTFDNYNLEVSTPYNKNYIIPPGSQSLSSTLSRGFSRLNANTIQQQINFEYYSKTSLTIRLHRALNDTFQSCDISYAFPFPYGSRIFSIKNQALAKDTVVTIVTGSNIFTTVNTYKLIKSNPFTYTVQNDSINCTPTGPNVIDVNY